MADKKPIGRLALRVEGDNWNAYYALNDTMEGAVPLGSITMMAVTRNPALKQAFMDLMIGVVSDILEDATGRKPTWSDPETAPEHERSRNA